MDNETETETQTELSPEVRLANLYRAYVGTEPAGLSGKQQRDALFQTKTFKDTFARTKDEGTALDDMGFITKVGQEVPAWLINANHEETRGKKKVGTGALFLLDNGRTRFVNFSGAMPSPPPLLTEFVFTGVTVSTNVDNGESTYSFSSNAPLQKAHGMQPPATDLTRSLEKAWAFNKKMGVVPGAPFGQTFAMLTITSSEDDIRFRPAGDFSDKPSLRYLAVDAAGNYVQVLADPEASAAQLGIKPDSPVGLWKRRLAGMRIAANGELDVFIQRGDSFFGGGDGFLAGIAASQGGRLQAPDKNGKRKVSLLDLYDAKSNLHPALDVGEKSIYRLESYIDRDGNERWQASIRADDERDNSGKPLTPTLNCVVKRGIGKKGDYVINEGAFAAYMDAREGVRQPTPRAKSLLMVE